MIVAGVGLLTPLGNSAWETFSALLAGRRLTDRVVGLEPDTAPVPLAQGLGGVSVGRHTATDPTVELAERAAREAAAEAGVSLAEVPTWLGTSKGAVTALGETGMDEAGQPANPLPLRLAQAVALGPHGYLSLHLAQRTGVEVRRHTVAACASSLTALHQARLALLPGSGTPAGPDHALVVTAEAALLPIFIHSYQRLGVLAPLTLDGYRERPLHAERPGFVLAEAGAAVLLKRLPPGQAPRPGQIELLDTDIATEAHDLIRPSPTMDALGAIAQRLVAGRPIAALHPHAPGTPEHDPLELRVLGDVLRQRPHPFHEEPHPPAVYANKGALGHTLGSAGLVSLVLATLAARTRKLPPMPWLDRPLAHTPLPLTARPVLPPDSNGGHLVTAAGFAGHVAAALIQRSP
ncbi:MAG: beta-ketoacyl synthase N-terminal-like domain-containing protein [Planctomycetota bacterium]